MKSEGIGWIPLGSHKHGVRNRCVHLVMRCPEWMRRGAQQSNLVGEIQSLSLFGDSGVLQVIPKLFFFGKRAERWPLAPSALQESVFPSISRRRRRGLVSRIFLHRVSRLRVLFLFARSVGFVQVEMSGNQPVQPSISLNRIRRGRVEPPRGSTPVGFI